MMRMLMRIQILAATNVKFCLILHCLQNRRSILKYSVMLTRKLNNCLNNSVTNHQAPLFTV